MNAFKSKSVKVYNLDEFEKLTQGVQVASCMLSEPLAYVVDEESVIKRIGALTLEGLVDGKKCSCCGVGPFETRAQQTAHYKNHWHTHNLKRKLFGKGALTLGEFNKRKDDNSSLSSGESDVEDDNSQSDLFSAVTRHCKAYYINDHGQVFSVYRCLLHHKKEVLSADGNGLAWVNACNGLTKPGALRWAVFMLSGGHFAGAIYSGSTEVVHKTFHSYVVRRGQGHSQSTRDAQGPNGGKSAGSSLRRYNQQQFELHVQEIITSWSDDLAGCSLVLHRAVGPTNQAVLFGKGSPLNKNDPRLRAFPFPTRKPTFKEVQRAVDIVATIDVYDTMEQFQKALIQSNTTTSKPQPNIASERSNSRKPQKISPQKSVDRAKSREPVERSPPVSLMSSEDEGPTCVDVELDSNWMNILKTCDKNKGFNLSTEDIEKQSDMRREKVNTKRDDSNLVKKDKKNSIKNDKSSKVEGMHEKGNKTKGKLKQQNGDAKNNQPIPINITEMWKIIKDGDKSRLETIIESWEGSLPEAVNQIDPSDGNTALHKAAIASSPDMVMQILNSGGDPCVRNHQQQTPYSAASQADTRIAFRMYQFNFPDKYNYAKAHIPGPLTPELLQQELDRKTAQRKLKRRHDKDKQQEKLNLAKFLEMTDAQKISAKIHEMRCFHCGTRIAKDPFQYADFTFCAIKCLQQHRKLRPLNMST